MTLPTPMKTGIKFILGSAAILGIAAGLLIFSTGKEAHASAPSGTPEVQIQLGDSHQTHPDVPPACDFVSGWVGSGDGQASLPRVPRDTADCMRIRILNSDPSTAYTRDFKICLGIPTVTQCTDWASDGGGGTWNPITENVGHILHAQVWVVDRAMPFPGMTIDHVSAGIQMYYQTDNHPCRGSSGMQWSSGPQSSWAYGENHDDDPGCARIGLSVRQVLPPDAVYTADTLPRQAQASTTYQSTITMTNKGLTWESDHILVPEQNNCMATIANVDGATCNDSVTQESTEFVLKRVDTTALTAPATLPYKRVINVVYTRYIGEDCYVEPGGDGGGGIITINNGKSAPDSIVGKVWRAIVPVAFALPQPGTVICHPFNFVSRYESPQANIFINDAADFPVTVGTPGASGTYILKYRMMQTSNQQEFGETATIPINVAGGSQQAFGLTCQTVSQTVNAGQTAAYTLSAAPINGFSGPVQIVVTSGLPAGTHGVTTTINVSGPSAVSGIVPVVTSASTPAGTYPRVNFHATATGAADQDCTGELVVQNAGSQPTLTVSPNQLQVALGQTANYTAMYDPDGVGGPQPAVSVTAPAAWSTDIPGVAVPTGTPGQFRGNATGSTPVWAAYNGLQASSSLIVGPSQATLRLEPGSASVTAGAKVTVRAMYDPDGPGGVGESDVSADSAWLSDTPAIAQSLDSGTYRGVAAGQTTMRATYQEAAGSLIYASGPLTVTGDTATSTPVLKVTPTSASVNVGGSIGFTARYYPQGLNGTSSDVTDISAWSSDSGVLTSNGHGNFSGATPGSAHAMAQYQRKSDQADVTVTASTGTCTFTANPATLFIPPTRATTLSWSCQPVLNTTCVVTNATDGGTVAQGPASGSGQSSPIHSTTYHLSCTNNVQQDLRVRVFDVTTRIEILPR